MPASNILKPGPRSGSGQPSDIQAALFDVDNTLIGNESPGLPSERFKAAVAAAQRRGIRVALASARPLAKTAHILDYIQADGLSILCNGAQIVDSRDKSVVAEWAIDPETCLSLIAAIDTMDVTYWINDDGVDYFPSPSGNGGFERQTDIWKHDSPRIAAPDYTPGKPFVINLRYITDAQAAETTRLVAASGNPDITTLIAHETPQPDGSKLYDQFIVHKQANKRHALHEVSRLQDIPLENFLAVGDGRNDAVLVGSAGVGVAMGNSAQETLDVATFIAPDREDDGAAVALEQFVR